MRPEVGAFIAAAGSEIKLKVLDVGETDLLQLASAAAVVLEVHLLERLGGDLLELLVVGALLLGVEEAGGVVGRQRDRQVPQLVRGLDVLSMHW